MTGTETPARRGPRALLAERGLGTLLFAKAAGNVGLNAAALVANVAIALLLSRFLGSGGYGAYAFATAIATVLTVPALLGLPSLVTRDIAAYRVRRAWGAIRGVIRWSNRMVLAASLVVCGSAALVFALGGWPHDPYRLPAYIGLALVPLTGVVSIRQSAMQGFGHVVVGRAPETLVTPLLVIVAIVVLDATLGARFSASWAMGASVAALLVGVLLGIWLLRRATAPEVRVAPAVFESRAWLVAAVPLVLTSGISVTNDQVGTIVLGAVGTSQEVGVFGIALRIAGLIPFLLVAAVPTLMPWISELNTLGDAGRLQWLMTRSARLIFFGSLPIALVVLVAATPLLRLFGSDFAGGATPLRILVLGQIVNVVTGVPGTILMMVHQAGRMTVCVTAGAVANVVLMILLAPRYGATGAAVATAASVALTNVSLALALWRSKRIWSPALALPR